MTSALSLTPPSAPVPGAAFAARVARADPVMVTLDVYGPEHEWGPVTWLSGASPAPGRGVRALALIDDMGRVWAFGDPGA